MVFCTVEKFLKQRDTTLIYTGSKLCKKFFWDTRHYPIKNHIVKVHLNTLLDANIKVMLFHHHCVQLPQMNAYAKHFDKNNEHVNLLVNDKKIFKKYSIRIRNEIRNKIKSLIKKEFNSEPVYDDKYIKTKIKIYNYRVQRNFQHNKKAKYNEYCACLSVILLYSIFVN